MVGASVLTSVAGEPGASTFGELLPNAVALLPLLLGVYGAQICGRRRGWMLGMCMTARAGVVFDHVRVWYSMLTGVEHQTG